MIRSFRFPPPLIALPIIAAAVLASLAAPAHAAQLVLMNNTVDRLVLYVENKRACAAEPGKDCAVQVDPGSHRIRATAPDGTSTYDVLTSRRTASSGPSSTIGRNRADRARSRSSRPPTALSVSRAGPQARSG